MIYFCCFSRFLKCELTNLLYKSTGGRVAASAGNTRPGSEARAPGEAGIAVKKLKQRKRALKSFFERSQKQKWASILLIWKSQILLFSLSMDAVCFGAIVSWLWGRKPSPACKNFYYWEFGDVIYHHPCSKEHIFSTSCTIVFNYKRPFAELRISDIPKKICAFWNRQVDISQILVISVYLNISNLASFFLFFFSWFADCWFHIRHS